jgi:nucleotide-binding universal stress UspA family protein
MYRKILITTDGSAVSSKTACAGVQFAEQLGAEVLVLFVAPEYQYPIYVEIIRPATPAKTNTAPPCSARAASTRRTWSIPAPGATSAARP